VNVGNFRATPVDIFRPEASLAAILAQRHVCCDCEIIFNLGATSG
jgi:hypothetical protein